MKGKLVLALKSLMLLQQRYNTSYDYLESLFRFITYIKDNKEKINEDFLILAYNKINLEEGLLEINKISVLNNEINPIRLVLSKLGMNNFICGDNKSRSQLLSDVLDDLFKESKTVMRNIKQTVYCYFINNFRTLMSC